MNIETAIKHALDGEALLFLGAGFSIGATNKLNKPLPIASELSLSMCKELGISPSDDLAIVSERFIDDRRIGQGITKFLDFLKNQLICIDTSKSQHEIVNNPWLRIYTTNYDNIVELSSKNQNIDRHVITATLPLQHIDRIEGAIIHMNGYIINIDPNKFYDEFKITNESYLKDGFLKSNWGSQFCHDVNNCKAIIFIGYSMKYDLELQQFMHKKISDKAIFINHETITENQKYLLEKWGTLSTMGVDKFADQILKVKANYTPTRKNIGLRSFKEVKISDYTKINISANDVINLLTFGTYDKYWFRTSDEYFLKRSEYLENVKNLMASHKICVIHSNFGNGKSIFLDYLASELIEENSIYYLENDKYILDDIRLIKERKTNINILFIDDYDQHVSFFKEIAELLDDNLKIIATCRTSLSDLLLDRLESEYNISNKDIGVENIEIITDKERKSLIRLLDQYALWGENSTLTFSKKSKLIQNKYKNRLSHIFYVLLESKTIENKMIEIFKALDSPNIRDFIFSETICDICSFKLKTFELARLINIPLSEIEKASFSFNFKEIFHRSSDNINLRSSVFSQYIVRQYKEYKTMGALLKKIYINSFNSNNDEYFTVRKKLISRSNLIEIFGGNVHIDSNLRDQEIYSFYNEIRDYSKENPFYWLQFAITALNLKKYPDAQIYFNNAYSYAEKLEGFDCFQLDTHYARFLFEELEKNDITLSYDKLQKAHRLLMDNSNAAIRLSYVLRQTSAYWGINQKFSSFFSPKQRLDFIQQVREVKEKYEEYFSTIEAKKKENFFFAIDIPVRKAYKTFRKLLLQLLPSSDIAILDQQFNRLVRKADRVN